MVIPNHYFIRGVFWMAAATYKRENIASEKHFYYSDSAIKI
jgi:hypothetical protein